MKIKKSKKKWIIVGVLIVVAALVGGCLYAIVFCVVIGVVFGFYPASKASILSPIEALRSN